MKHSRRVISYKSFVINRTGFTIIELLVFSAIFALVMVSFITILVAIVRVQSRQSAVAQVNEESQFLLQRVQYYIERSSLVQMDQDVTSTVLKLRMAASSSDPTYIYLLSGTVYLKQTDAGAPQALTTPRVNVTSLVFTKRSNAPSNDSVDVSFVVTNNTQNLTQQFSQALQTAVARVSAATFDSNVIPSSSAVYKLGVSGQTWSSVNDMINFTASCAFGNCVGVNLGVGVSPTQVFQVHGGDIYVDTSLKGIILRNSGGCVRLYYTDSGQIATSSIGCT